MERKTVSIVLERSTKKKIKLACALRGWSLAKFFEGAMAEAIAKLEEAERDGCGYRLREMSDESRLHRTSIWVDGELAAELDEKRGAGVLKRAVYYTAIHEFLEGIEEDGHE